MIKEPSLVTRIALIQNFKQHTQVFFALKKNSIQFKTAINLLTLILILILF